MAEERVFEEVSFQNADSQNQQDSHEDDVDELDIKDQKRARYKQDTKYRKYLAIWVMWVV